MLIQANERETFDTGGHKMTELGEDRFFDSNGVPIHYIVKGSGPSVVLLHGFTRSIKIPWVEYGFFSGSFDGYQLIAMDCRGHGRSGKPHMASAYGQKMVDDVIRLFDHLQVERAHLIGHSMGAEIALKALIQNPARVQSAILAGSGWSDERVYGIYKPLAESLERGDGLGVLLEWITPVGEPAPTVAQVHELNDSLLAGNDVLALAAICRNYDELQELRVTEPELRSIQAPVLGITGEHDIERAMLERMKGVVPQFTMSILAGLGHTGPAFFSALAVESLRFLSAEAILKRAMG
jgi:pimeloyl-ACP methyl ester carboxylesterase